MVGPGAQATAGISADIIWAKPNPMPESVTDRPTKSHEYVFLLSKSAHYYFDQEAVREAHGAGRESCDDTHRVDARPADKTRMAAAGSARHRVA